MSTFLELHLWSFPYGTSDLVTPSLIVEMHGERPKYCPIHMTVFGLATSHDSDLPLGSYEHSSDSICVCSRKAGPLDRNIKCVQIWILSNL